MLHYLELCSKNKILTLVLESGGAEDSLKTKLGGCALHVLNMQEVDYGVWHGTKSFFCLVLLTVLVTNCLFPCDQHGVIADRCTLRRTHHRKPCWLWALIQLPTHCSKMQIVTMAYWAINHHNCAPKNMPIKSPLNCRCRIFATLAGVR